MPSIQKLARNSDFLWVATLFLCLVVFVIDLYTPRGVTPYVFYLIPATLALGTRKTWLPLTLAALFSVLMFAGFLIDLSGSALATTITPQRAVINRLGAGLAFWMMAWFGTRLIRARVASERHEWIKAGQTQLDAKLREAVNLEDVTRQAISVIATYTGAEVGALYLVTPGANGKDELRLSAGHALSGHAARERLEVGEGWTGQVIREKRPVLLENLPADFLPVATGLGSAGATSVLLVPTLDGDHVNGVIELGFRGSVAPMAQDFLQEAARAVHTAINAARYKDQLERLLRRTQEQAEQLQAQQEELRVGNEELEERNRSLREAQARLEQQQAELEQTNEQLEEQTTALEEQRNLLRLRNDEVESARASLKEHAERLETASRYKSEFLANMSHELRTPLNSSLILAKLLSENREGNLSAEQIQYAETIYGAGNDLLNLINDILDLSKVAAGKLRIHPEPVTVTELARSLETTFEPVALQKGLSFEVRISDDVPVEFTSDRQRVEQILKNFLSNAFKFTERGSVRVEIGRGAVNGRDGLAFSVSDSGIGIPEEQQEVIFEAFRQADGTTSRRYGGTGLGLSISRDLAQLLGGEVRVKSRAGEGSTFTLVLPSTFTGSSEFRPTLSAPPAAGESAVEKVAGEVNQSRPAPAPVPAAAEKPARAPAAFADDRESPRDGLRTLLVIEDDAKFARILYDLAHELKFRCLVAADSEEGLELARTQRPDGILLDIKLPDVSGLSVLDRLKEDSHTRHIPVHVVSGMDHVQTAMQMGAIGYALKPVPRDRLREAIGRLEERLTRTVKRVLVVEDDRVQRDSICALVTDGEVEAEGVATAHEALKRLSRETYDTIIMDLTLPDMSGFDLLETMSRDAAYSHPPVIVYTARSLSSDEEARLRRYSESIIIKGARSPERLLDEVTLFLHKVEADLPPERQKMLQKVRHRDKLLEGRKILIADDDARNIFALTAVLEEKGAKVISARDGREALGRLEAEPDVDLVLMDIMMPQMDGYEATRMIRKSPRFANLPVIAVTAKAMRDDQEKSLKAGANDYLAKPVNVDKLLSLVRVWMPARAGV